MSKTEILEELPKLTKTERQEIRLRLAELDGDDWLDNDDPLTVHEKALLEARLAAYAKDPDAGSIFGIQACTMDLPDNIRPGSSSASRYFDTHLDSLEALETASVLATGSRNKWRVPW